MAKARSSCLKIIVDRILISVVCSLDNSHDGSIKGRKKKSVGRRTSVSSDKGAPMKDEENLSLPEVEEGTKTKKSYAGQEEGHYLTL